MNWLDHSIARQSIGYRVFDTEVNELIYVSDMFCYAVPLYLTQLEMRTFKQVLNKKWSKHDVTKLRNLQIMLISQL
jgi:hypothetical protein